MAEKFRIKFNPVTKEIEIEGTEDFVKIYFDKLSGMLSGTADRVAEEPKGEEIISGKRTQSESKEAKVRSSGSTTNQEQKKGSNMDRVISLIQGAPEGISTTELKQRSGFTDRQVWSIVTRAAKIGKIRKVKKGLYGRVLEPQERKTL